MVQIAMLVGLTLLALGFAVGGNAARVCHIAATVAFGIALIISLIGIS